MDKVFETVRDIIAEQFNMEADKIKMDSTFIDDLGADSLDIVELIMSLEEEFDMEISDEDAEKIVSIEDVVDYINENL